jgi:hypothetical protein
VIVRILGEGQLEVGEEHLEPLNALDAALEEAVNSDDDERFRSALSELLTRVRGVGEPLPDDALAPSDLVLPAEDAHVDEVRAMLSDEGLIPG